MVSVSTPWCQLAHHQLMSQQGSHFSSHSRAKTNDKAHFSGRMVSSDITDVGFASVYSEKTRLKKLMMMKLIGERAKRARHSQVCSIENRGYIYYHILYIIYI